MSLKRKMMRSPNRVEYVHTTDENGDDILIVKKGGRGVDVVKLFAVNKDADGKKTVTITEDDGTERTMPVADFIKQPGYEVKTLVEDEHGIKEK